MTPRFRCSEESRSKALRAPRSLNDPVRCRYSSLQNTLQPVASDNGTECGQGEWSTAEAIRSAADVISSNPIDIPFSSPPRGRECQLCLQNVNAGSVTARPASWKGDRDDYCFSGEPWATCVFCLV